MQINSHTVHLYFLKFGDNQLSGMGTVAELQSFECCAGSKNKKREFSLFRFTGLSTHCMVGNATALLGSKIDFLRTVHPCLMLNIS